MNFPYINIEADRKRLFLMNVNALIGYVLVEVGITIAKFLHLTSITYFEIFSLSLVANLTTICAILLIIYLNNFNKKIERILFISELLIYFIILFIAISKISEIRFVGMIFAFIAITIEIPFSTMSELLYISFGSVFIQICATFFSIYILEQQGNFYHELFYTLCFIPSLIIIMYVKRQINAYKDKIKADKMAMEQVNWELIEKNTNLEKYQRSTTIDMELAGQIQEMILSQQKLLIPDWDIAYYFKPKFGASGDFYDFYVDNNELKGFGIFDVAGHGVSSALITVLIKPVIAKYFYNGDAFNLAKVFQSVNEHINREFSELDLYITGVLLRFNKSTIEYISAGHPELLLKRAGTEKVRAIEPKDGSFRGEPLGINLREGAYKTVTFKIEIGDTLLLYTDCLLECKHKNVLLGKKRLLSSLQNAPNGSAEKILNHIIDDFNKHMVYNDLRDDLTIIVAKKREA